MPNSIILFIPVYNEEHIIGEIIQGVPRDVIDEVVIIDDGSTDRTAAIAKEKGATIIPSPHRQHVGAALRICFDYAIKRDCKIAVIMAGNGKDDPIEIPRLVQPIIEGKADLVQGSRYLPGGYYNNMPLHRRIGTRLYPHLLRWATGFPATDGTNGFRAIKIDIIKDQRIDWRQDWLNSTAIEYYLPIKALKLGYRHVEVPVSKRYPSKIGLWHYHRYTKVRPFVDWWNILKPVIYLSLGIKK